MELCWTIYYRQQNKCYPQMCLLAHFEATHNNNKILTCYCGQISLQSDNLTTLGVAFNLLAMVHNRSLVCIFCEYKIINIRLTLESINKIMNICGFFFFNHAFVCQEELEFNSIFWSSCRPWGSGPFGHWLP